MRLGVKMNLNRIKLHRTDTTARKSAALASKASAGKAGSINRMSMLKPSAEHQPSDMKISEMEYQLKILNLVHSKYGTVLKESNKHILPGTPALTQKDLECKSSEFLTSRTEKGIYVKNILERMFCLEVYSHAVRLGVSAPMPDNLEDAIKILMHLIVKMHDENEHLSRELAEKNRK